MPRSGFDERDRSFAAHGRFCWGRKIEASLRQADAGPRPRERGVAMKKLAAFLALTLLLCAQSAFAQYTLKAVKDRGILNCGANGTLAGFGLPDAQGQWTGLDVDVCRVVA